MSKISVYSNYFHIYYYLYTHAYSKLFQVNTWANKLKRKKSISFFLNCCWQRTKTRRKVKSCFFFTNVFDGSTRVHVDMCSVTWHKNDRQLLQVCIVIGIPNANLFQFIFFVLVFAYWVWAVLRLFASVFYCRVKIFDVLDGMVYFRRNRKRKPPKEK